MSNNETMKAMVAAVDGSKDRYWPADERQKESVDGELNALIAHICAETPDPVERDALAQYAGDCLRHHVARWQADPEPEAPALPEREWLVPIIIDEVSVWHGSVTVKAASPDEAREIAEDGSFESESMTYESLVDSDLQGFVTDPDRQVVEADDAS